ncbi:unnamed protein product [Lactuca virosa]|uniref:Cytochrome P450 n=1 Tax=Lactuca virosa TaxID=75947 RepID=A0AAU9NRI7_9ASTR|nr:unnamed protein product [Lactuca virosa]
MDMVNILSFIPSWFLSITLLLFLPYIFIHNIRRKSSIKLPPGPRRLPIIGNLHQLLGNEGIHQTLWKLSHIYGPAMLLHFGSQPFLVISSSEMASEVLRTHDQKLCSRPYSQASKRLSFDYMDAAFSPYSDHWKHMRKVLASEFLGAKRSRLYKNVMEIEMEGVVRSVTSHTSSTIVNLDDMFSSIVNEVVCKVAFGDSYGEKKFNGMTLKEIVDESLVMLGVSFSDIFPTFGPILDRLSGWNRRLETCFSHLDGFLQMVIDQHETKTSDQEKDFVDDCSSGLTTYEVKALLMNVIEGALDTTAITMVWAFSEIVKNPRVMQKLQNEIRSFIGRKASLHESDVANMAYLKMVVKETLRLHPPAPFLMARECVSHCQIGGYDVLPGTRVMVSSWGIGRDPRNWKESPTQFCPERFENTPLEYFGGSSFDMIPFGGGKKRLPWV